MKTLKICGFAAALWLCAAGMAFGQSEADGFLIGELNLAPMELVSDTLSHQVIGVKSASYAAGNDLLQVRAASAHKSKSKRKKGCFSQYWQALKWMEAFDQF